MNTTVTSPVSSITDQPHNPAFFDLDQEMAALLAQLENLEQRKQAQIKAEQETAQKRREEALTALKALITETAATFGLNGGAEVLALLKDTISPPRVSNRIPDETLAQMKQMLEGGATLSATAKALGVGEASVSNYKAKWGMVKGKVKSGRARRSGGRYQIAPEKRAAIIADLIARVPVAKISRKHGPSRQSIYGIKSTIPAAQLKQAA